MSGFRFDLADDLVKEMEAEHRESGSLDNNDIAYLFLVIHQYQKRKSLHSVELRVNGQVAYKNGC